MLYKVTLPTVPMQSGTANPALKSYSVSFPHVTSNIGQVTASAPIHQLSEGGTKTFNSKKACSDQYRLMLLP